MPRLLLPIALASIAGLIGPNDAAAHAILMESQPAARTAIPPGATSVTLRFNSRIDHARSRIALRHGTLETTLPVDPASPPDILATSATLTPGAYVIRWQVLAVDGHITRGDVPFTVTQ